MIGRHAQRRPRIGGDFEPKNTTSLRVVGLSYPKFSGVGPGSGGSGSHAPQNPPSTDHHHQTLLSFINHPIHNNNVTSQARQKNDGTHDNLLHFPSHCSVTDGIHRPGPRLLNCTPARLPTCLPGPRHTTSLSLSCTKRLTTTTTRIRNIETT